jgi:hypothetical protein
MMPNKYKMQLSREINTMKAQTPVQFFYANAGFSYDPKTETKAQGKMRCARLLANAEKQAARLGFSAEWMHDTVTSAEFNDNSNYALWYCLLRDGSGKVVESLGGVDFGDGGTPWGNSYRRVVEAELALEALSN